MVYPALVTLPAQMGETILVVDDEPDVVGGGKKGLKGYEGLIRTVDTHVRRLREKLGQAANRIVTVRGEGYRFLTNRTP